jgi:DNA-directed RNA polymerase specialized sigma24 family protein
MSGKSCAFACSSAISRASASNSGRGPLSAWVRMAAIRVALTFLERDKVRSRARDVSALGALAGETTSPELAAVRNRHASAFQAALERASMA